jgi:Snf7
MKRANKPKSQILRELKKKKLLEQHVESARMALLNLEQTQSTLDTATSQVEIVKLLHVSRDTWRNMQGEVTSEQVDEMVFDLQEEMELGTELNAVLATTTGGYRLNEEDALLEELESLTLSEGRSKGQTTRNVQTTQHLEATVVAADMVGVASMEDSHERPSQSASNAKPCTAESPTLAS